MRRRRIVAVTPVAIERSTFSDQERVTVTAGVANHGGKAVDGVDVTLEVNGRADPDAARQDRRERVDVHHVCAGDADGRRSSRHGPARQRRDGARQRRFTSWSRPAVRSRRCSPGGAARATRGLYVGTRAGGRRDAEVRADIARRGRHSPPTTSSRASIVVLNDVQVSSSAAERLGRFVERGGGLLVIASQRGTWPQDRAAVLPGAARAKPSIERAGRPRGWSASSMATRSSSRSARRAAAISRRRASTAIAP